jgi:imidazolonepropionase-like amidohydrolase
MKRQHLHFARPNWLGKLTLFICLLAVTVMALWSFQTFESGTTSLNRPHSNSFVLCHVNVLTMRDANILENQTIVVQNGKITNIAPDAATFPDDLQVIDGDGQYVMPGLIDLHVHILDRSYAKSALAAGVTTVRNMGGFPYHLKWQKELESRKWFGARLITSSPIMNSVAQGDPLSHFMVDDPMVARKAVRDFIREGYDFIKVYEGLNAAVYQAILDEANKLGVAVAGHPSYALMASSPELHASLRTFEHTEEIYDGFLHQKHDLEGALAAARFLSEYTITLVPTLAVNRELTRLSNEKQGYLAEVDLNGMNPFVRTIYEQTSFKRWLNASSELAQYNLKTDAYFHELTRLMHEQGVELGLGSDAGALTGLPGPASVDELLLMAEAGIDHFSILQAATTQAAKVLFLDNQLGQLAPHYQADMLVLKENPLISLTTLRQPEMVIQQGRIFDRSDLKTLSKEAHEHSGWLLSILRHLDYLVFG